MNNHIAVNNPILGNLNSFLTGGGSPNYFSALLSTLVTIFLLAGGVAFLFMFLIGGIGWITAGGDKARVEEARTKLTNAGIGLLVLLAIWAILTAVEQIFGINITSIDIASLVIN